MSASSSSVTSQPARSRSAAPPLDGGFRFYDEALVGHTLAANLKVSRSPVSAYVQYRDLYEYFRQLRQAKKDSHQFHVLSLKAGNVEEFSRRTLKGPRDGLDVYMPTYKESMISDKGFLLHPDDVERLRARKASSACEYILVGVICESRRHWSSGDVSRWQTYVFDRQGSDRYVRLITEHGVLEEHLAVTVGAWKQALELQALPSITSGSLDGLMSDVDAIESFLSERRFFFAKWVEFEGSADEDWDPQVRDVAVTIDRVQPGVLRKHLDITRKDVDGRLPRFSAITENRLYPGRPLAVLSVDIRLWDHVRCHVREDTALTIEPIVRGTSRPPLSVGTVEWTDSYGLADDGVDSYEQTEEVVEPEPSYTHVFTQGIEIWKTRELASKASKSAPASSGRGRSARRMRKAGRSRRA